MNDKKNHRVLILVENNSYPQDTRVRHEARTLVTAGYQVTVIAPRYAKQAFREDDDGVILLRYPSPPSAEGLLGYIIEYGYSLVAMFFLSLIVFFGRGFDVIHACNPPDILVLIGAFYRVFGKRFVFDHHDLSPEMYHARFERPGNRFVTRVLIMFEKFSCRLADHVISTNESYKRMAVERSGIEAERVTVVRNGPDLQRIRLTEPDANLRNRNQVILGFVGVMGYQDGIDYLLRALFYLTYELGRRDYYCVLVGRGDAWERMRELATELRLDEHVWFTGRASDEELMSYLSASDICLDPDPSNPFNDRSTMIKMAEYMALGKPIVAFDLPEHRVTASEAALYARPNVEQDYALKIAQLMDDPNLRDRMGQIGRKRVESELAWPHQAKHLVDVYDSLCPLRSGHKSSLAPAAPSR